MQVCAAVAPGLDPPSALSAPPSLSTPPQQTPVHSSLLRVRFQRSQPARGRSVPGTWSKSTTHVAPHNVLTSGKRARAQGASPGHPGFCAGGEGLGPEPGLPNPSPPPSSLYFSFPKHYISTHCSLLEATCPPTPFFFSDRFSSLARKVYLREKILDIESTCGKTPSHINTDLKSKERCPAVWTLSDLLKDPSANQSANTAHAGMHP